MFYVKKKSKQTTFCLLSIVEPFLIVVVFSVPLDVSKISEVVEDVIVPVVVIRLGWLVVAASNCCCQGAQ